MLPRSAAYTRPSPRWLFVSPLKTRPSDTCPPSSACTSRGGAAGRGRTARERDRLRCGLNTRLPAVQPALCGPLYRLNVTVPTPAPVVTGLTSPVILAVSPIDPPTAPFVAWVLIAGCELDARLVRRGTEPCHGVVVRVAAERGDPVIGPRGRRSERERAVPPVTGGPLNVIGRGGLVVTRLPRHSRHSRRQDRCTAERHRPASAPVIGLTNRRSSPCHRSARRPCRCCLGRDDGCSELRARLAGRATGTRHGWLFVSPQNDSTQ